MGLCHSNRSNDDYQQMMHIYDSDGNLTKSYPLPKNYEESYCEKPEHYKCIYWCPITNLYQLDTQHSMSEGCSGMALTWKKPYNH